MSGLGGQPGGGYPAGMTDLTSMRVSYTRAALRRTDLHPDPLEQFQAWVAEGKIHYFVPGRTGGEGQGTAAQITSWVEATFTAQTVRSTTVYDLTTGS